MSNFSRALIAAVTVIGSASWAQRAPAGRVSFYEVPLRCPAARNLGCGGASKPILSALEKNPKIQEAWLDHQGTTLAIVWKKGVTSDERAAQIRAESEEWHMTLHELNGDLRDAL